MQIKAGQYYRTRGGRKAFVAAVENPLNPGAEFPLCGFVHDNRGSTSWTKSGQFETGENPYDLIAEWKEPITVTYWYCLWDDGGTSIHIIRPPPVPSLKAIKQVTITEGEGM